MGRKRGTLNLAGSNRPLCIDNSEVTLVKLFTQHKEEKKLDDLTNEVCIFTFEMLMKNSGLLFNTNDVIIVLAIIVQSD